MLHLALSQRWLWLLLIAVLRPVHGALTREPPCKRMIGITSVTRTTRPTLDISTATRKLSPIESLPATFEPQLDFTKAKGTTNGEFNFKGNMDFFKKQQGDPHIANPQLPSHGSIPSATFEPQLNPIKAKGTTDGEFNFKGNMDFFKKQQGDPHIADPQLPSHGSISSATIEPKAEPTKVNWIPDRGSDYQKTLAFWKALQTQNRIDQSVSERMIAKGIAWDQDKVKQIVKRPQELEHDPGHDSVASLSRLKSFHRSMQFNLASTPQLAFHHMPQFSALRLSPNRRKLIFSPVMQIHRPSDSMAVSLKAGNPTINKLIEKMMKGPREDISTAGPGMIRDITPVKSGISNSIAQSSLPLGEQVVIQKPQIQLLVVVMSNVWNTKPIQHTVSIADGQRQIHLYLQPELYERISAWFSQIGLLQRQSGKGVNFKPVRVLPGKSLNTNPEVFEPIAGSSIPTFKEITPQKPLFQSSVRLISHVFHSEPIERTIPLGSHPAASQIYLDRPVYIRLSATVKQLRQRETAKSAENVLTNSATDALNEKSSPVGPSGPLAHNPILLRDHRSTTAETGKTAQDSSHIYQFNPIRAIFRTVSSLSDAPKKVISNLLRNKFRSFPDRPKVEQAQQLNLVNKFNAPQILTNALVLLKSLRRAAPGARPRENLANQPWSYSKMRLSSFVTNHLKNGFKKFLERINQTSRQVKPSATRESPMTFPTAPLIAEFPKTKEYLGVTHESFEIKVLNINQDTSDKLKNGDKDKTLKAHKQDKHDDSQPTHLIDDGFNVEDGFHPKVFDAPRRAKQNQPNTMSWFVPKLLNKFKIKLVQVFSNLKKYLNFEHISRTSRPVI